MYSIRHNLTIGFHGCDKEVVDSVINHQSIFKPSLNKYDWLGHGFYFCEQNYHRALEFAESAVNDSKITKGKIKTPAVLGAVIELGNCLDLLESNSLKILRKAHEALLENPPPGVDVKSLENKKRDVGD